jgi:hypothetical protein
MSAVFFLRGRILGQNMGPHSGPKYRAPALKPGPHSGPKYGAPALKPGPHSGPKYGAAFWAKIWGRILGQNMGPHSGPKYRAPALKHGPHLGPKYRAKIEGFPFNFSLLISFFLTHFPFGISSR